ncbi:MAG TPA: hypothetical protein VFX61_17280 [Micromonosporaceae bacterium]|nr:hypothetical protein [Micromonosporaceae bacterium]
MPSTAKAHRWRQILSELRPQLPGTWSIRGTGLDTMLVREPLDWSLAWIGYADSPTRPLGWVAAGVQPLVTPMRGFVMTYGARMDEVPSGPRTVDLLSDVAADHTRQFVLGPGLEKINSWPPIRLAEVAERDFAQNPRGRRTYWHQLPGWRVVNGTASPVEPATQLAELCRERARASGKAARKMSERATFYEQLRQTWAEGERDAALRFLVEQRNRALAAEQLDRVSAP